MADRSIQSQHIPPPLDRPKLRDKWRNVQPTARYLILDCEEFCVVLDDVLEIDWETDDAYDDVLDQKSVDVGKISNRVMFLQAIPINHLSDETRLAFRRMVAEGMARILEGNERGAQAILDEAEEFVTARNREQARRWYVWSSFGAMALTFGVTAVAAWVFARLYPGVQDGPTNIFVAGFGGATGALFSILLRVGNAELDPAAGVSLHRLEATARVMVGVIGAVIIVAAIRVGIVLPQLTSKAGLILVCIVAGASERAAWTIIERVEVALSDPDLPKRRSGPQRERSRTR